MARRPPGSIAFLRFISRRFVAQRMLGLAVVVTFSFSIGLLVAGPVYARGGREAIWSSALGTAGPHIVNARYLVAAPGGFDFDSADEAVTGAIRRVPVSTTVVRQGKAASSFDCDLCLPPSKSVRAFFREGAKEHLPNFEGTAPGLGEVALPRQLASTLGVDIGDVANGPVPLTVSAIFDIPDPNDPYWFGERSPFPPPRPDYVEPGDPTDYSTMPVLLSQAGFQDLVARTGTSAEYAWDTFLDLEGERLDHVSILPGALRSAADEIRQHSSLSRVQLQTGLDGLLRLVGTRVSHLWLPIILVALLMGAVSLAVLAGVGALAISRQGFELAVMHSRGASKRRLLWAQGAQAGLWAAISFPLGLVLGLSLARLAALSNGPALPSSTFPIALNPAALALGAATALLGALILLLLSAPSVKRTILEERRAVSREDRPLAARIPMELFVVPVGIVAFIQLRVAGVPGADAIEPLLLLAPTLIILAASFFALRVGLFGMKRTDRVIGRSRVVPRYLALRRLGRSPGIAYAAGVLLVLSMGLLIVAASYRATAVGSYRDAAQQQVGSDHLALAGWAGWQLEAMHNVPPGMTPVYRAEIYLDTPGLSKLPEGLGIDPATYADGGWWRSDYSEASLGELLDRVTTEPPGMGLGPDAQTVGVTLEAPPEGELLKIGATFLTPDGVSVTPPLDSVAPGVGTYGFEAPANSRLLSITLWQEGTELLPEEMPFTVGVSAGDRELDMAMWRPMTWKQSGGELSTDGTLLLNPGTGKVIGGIQPAFAPLAAIVSEDILATQDDEFTATFSGIHVPLRIEATAQRFPSVLDGKPFLVLSGRALMELAQAIPEGSIALNEVWAKGEDPTVELTEAGWIVGSVASAEPIEAALLQLPRALAIGMFASSAAAGLALVVIGVTMALSFQQRRRDYEFAALRAMGTTDKQIRRTLVLEQAILVGFAVSVGIGIGYAMLRLTMPYVGRSLASPVPEPLLVLDAPVLIASVAAICVASVVGVWVASKALLSSSVTGVLRSEAE